MKTLISRRQFAGGMAAVLAVASSGIALAMPSESPLEELRRICRERRHVFSVRQVWSIVDQTLLVAIYIDVMQALIQYPLHYEAHDRLMRSEVARAPEVIDRKLNDMAREMIFLLKEHQQA